MKKSFTLIELMIVISIIALLSSLGLNTYSSFQKNARDTRRKADLKTITEALNAYYSVNGKYPPAGNCALGTNCNKYSYPDSTNWIPALVTDGYIEQLPIDPINNAAGPWTVATANYSYSYGNVSTNAQEYDLTARLENTNDADRCQVKAYKWYFNGSRYWCTNGGTYSGQIYEYSPNSF